MQTERFALGVAGARIELRKLHLNTRQRGTMAQKSLSDRFPFPRGENHDFSG
jgi:hypothetical protein